jgi:hypothetical protein
MQCWIQPATGRAWETAGSKNTSPQGLSGSSTGVRTHERPCHNMFTLPADVGERAPNRPCLAQAQGMLLGDALLTRVDVLADGIQGEFVGLLCLQHTLSTTWLIGLWIAVG